MTKHGALYLDIIQHFLRWPMQRKEVAFDRPGNHIKEKHILLAF